MPASVAAFVAYPDWNLGYFVAWERVGWPGVFALEAILFALLWLGRATALFALERGGSRGAVLWPAIAGLLGCGLTIALVWDRYVAELDAAFVRFSVAAGVFLILPLVALLAYSFFRPMPR